jgi:hypothetical protein
MRIDCQALQSVYLWDSYWKLVEAIALNPPYSSSKAHRATLSEVDGESSRKVPEEILEGGLQERSQM